MTRRSGFTLIELLIVVVIIGILASMVIPKFRDTKGKAYAAGLRSDLRNIATAQEAYFYQYSTYAPDTAGLNVQLSPGNTITISNATVSGWGATATNAASFPLTCALYIGSTAPVSPATVEGIVGCN